MTLLIGTRDGLYRTDQVPFEQPEKILDCGMVPRIRTFDERDGVWVTSHDGLFHSTDGETWTSLDVPADQVWEVQVDHYGDIYVGTHPARIYRSSDGGDTWEELEAFQAHTTRDRWRAPIGGDARVRTFGYHPDEPDRIAAGVEAGGFYISNDRGANWHRVNIDGQHDMHRILALGPEEYLVVCGRLSTTDLNHAANTGGMYHTTNLGNTWTRLDTSVQPSYYRDILYHEETLYACGSLTIPPVWAGGLPAEGSLFESRDMGLTFEEKPYPGGPEEIILAWAIYEGQVVGGTASGGQVGPGEPEGGRLVRRSDTGEWEEIGPVPVDVHSIGSI